MTVLVVEIMHRACRGSHGCGVLGHAGQAVGVGGVGLDALGGGSAHCVDVVSAVADQVVILRRITSGAIGVLQAVGRSIPQRVAIGRRQVVINPRQVHAVAIGIGQ
jgi:hypothetical protein